MSLLFNNFSHTFPSEFKAAIRALDQGTCLPRHLEGLTPRPALDCIETEKGFEVHADVPGVDRKDINLSFSEDGTTLTLSGTVKRSWSSDPAESSAVATTTTDAPAAAESASTPEPAAAPTFRPKPHHTERFTGSFSRSLRFPSTIDAAQTRASLKDGVLLVSVPKKAIVEPRPISIE